jgi:hypothetical protein
MILVGSVVGETDRGINIFVPFPERIDKLYGCHESVSVEFVDKRRVSAKQRRKAYVLISLGLRHDDGARLFITYLIDFCLLHGVDVGEPLYQLSEDIPRYVWACLMNKRCAVCGRKAELHHVDAVGMGRNRKEICHIGMRALPLCREHHTEIHAVGWEDFLRRYILEPVKIDERIADVYRLWKNRR